MLDRRCVLQGYLLKCLFKVGLWNAMIRSVGNNMTSRDRVCEPATPDLAKFLTSVGLYAWPYDFDISHLNHPAMALVLSSSQSAIMAVPIRLACLVCTRQLLLPLGEACR